MHEKLKEYLENAAKKEKELLAQELDDAGIYGKEYTDRTEYSEEYPEIEWDAGNEQRRYYRKIPIELTQEEVEEFRRAYRASASKSTNPIAVALTVIAWVIFIGGFLAGLCLSTVEVGTYFTHEEFSFSIALTYWSAALVCGTLLLGFAEIIKLLNDIKNK